MKMSDIFGDYKPPRWFTKGKEKAVSVLKRNSRKCKIALVVLAAVAVAVFIAKKAYDFVQANKPVNFSVDCYINEPYFDADYDPIRWGVLSINFSSSVAELSDIGKQTQQVEIKPPVKGSWVWEDESVLRFEAAENFKVATKYVVTLKKDLVASHITLETTELDFTTGDFSVDVGSMSYEIDDVNPDLKFLTFEMSANLPFDEESFAGKIKFVPDMKNPRNGTLEKRDYKAEVRFSGDHLRAYVTSEPLGMPATDVDMRAIIASGIASTAGGKKMGADERYYTISGMGSYACVNDCSVVLAQNEDGDEEQVVSLSLSGKSSVDAIGNALEIYVLPKDRPEEPGRGKISDYGWYSTEDVTKAVLAQSKKISFAKIPTENEYSALQSFKIDVAEGAYLYVRVASGVKFYGGYVMQEDAESVVHVPHYRKSLEIVSEGNVISMKGSHRVPIISRGISKFDVSLWRLRDDSVNDIVTQSNGSMKNFRFDSYSFDENNVGSLFEDTVFVNGADKDPRKAVVTNFDLSKYLKKGIFIFEVRGRGADEDYYYGGRSNIRDKRLILVTDLGIIVKKNSSGGKDIFVQSILNGTPVSGATVEVIERNGSVLRRATTDAGGHVNFRDTKNESGVRAYDPVAYQVTLGDDTSFMPYDSGERRLDFSDFDVGGTYGVEKADEIRSFVFSDRGIYRPGEEVRLGVITKTGDWSKGAEGLPCVFSVYNPKGKLYYSKESAIGESGMNEIVFKTDSNDLTGVYDVSVELKKTDSYGREYRVKIGYDSIKVEEFLPDTLEIKSLLSSAGKILGANGWVKPGEVKASVTLRNLFGTAASGNKIDAEISLKPGFARVTGFPGYRFVNPFVGSDSYTERLEQTVTDGEGKAEFSIDLDKYRKASYLLSFDATGYEKESGRNVSTSSSIYVSPLDYLVGWKTDGSLSYIGKDAKRTLSFVAVGPDLSAVDVNNIEWTLTETKFVSVLVKQPNGVYKYQSVRKEYPVETKKIAIGKSGLEIPLDIKNAGEFTITLKNSDGIKMCEIPYSIISEKNVQRSLARTAELELKAESASANPGEPLKIFLKAPYAGSGLICIERGKVYNYKWFTSSGTASEQTIEIPRELDGAEGNAYVTVLYKRDSKSDEIFMNPFCYAAIPISISLSKRTEQIRLSVPEQAKPGKEFPITYSGTRKSKVAIFAVDEGILNVAKYTKPNPLSFFFKKRALETETYEMLDLIMPEFEAVRLAHNMGAAGGGEGFSALAKNLNPFKRKQNETVAFWSGLVDIDETERTVKYRVPDHFNGRLHVFAVSASSDSIGVADTSAEIKADYVIVANSPTFAAPGDVFDVPVTVTNTVWGTKNTDIVLNVTPSSALEIVGDRSAKMTLSEGKDATFRFQFKALEKNGNADITFVADGGGKSSKITVSMSIRPSMPYRVFTTSGMVRKGVNKKDSIDINRPMYDEYATRSVALSYLPSGMAEGLKFYLSKYPYGCSEQVTSRAFPYLYEGDRDDAEMMVNNAFAVISTRQKSNGAIGYWTEKSDSIEFLDCYCALFLGTAREKGWRIPESAFSKLKDRLSTIAGMSDNTYARAFAIYVLTKNEVVTKSYLDSLKETLTKEDKMTASGMFAAASYKMLGMDSEAKSLLSKIRRNANRGESRVGFEDDLFFDSLYLLLISEHFPERLADISGELLERMQKEIENCHYNSLSSAFACMALEKYRAIVPTAETGKFSVVQKFAKEKKIQPQEIKVSGEGVFRGEFDGNAVSLGIENSEKTDLFYQVVQGGFQREIPKKAETNGIEVFREFSVDGKVVSEFKVGDTVDVKVSLRSKGKNNVYNIAVIDMLPSGLETDIASARKSTDEWDYVDIREDRIVLYGSARDSVRSFTYKAKAITSGSFVVPPLFAESMYDRDINAIVPQEPVKVVR